MLSTRSVKLRSKLIASNICELQILKVMYLCLVLLSHECWLILSMVFIVYHIGILTLSYLILAHTGS